MDQTPRKRGRPPKHPKAPGPPSAAAQSTVFATARGVVGGNAASDVMHNQKSGPAEGEDVEMTDRDRSPIVRTGQRGRPQKRGVIIKKSPSSVGPGGKGTTSDREYSKEVEGGNLELDERATEKTTRRGKYPAATKLHLQSDTPWHTSYDDGNGQEDVKDAPFMDAVVKVFCVHTEPNFSLPWQRKRQFSSNSSGFIISERRVLTNAHSVEHHTQVKVKKRGSDTKYLATVLAIGTECDIAMLTVSNDEFWEDVTPVEFGSLPRLQDAVTVVGYPIGGDTISVTSGVVSRIEVTSYVHGATELLGVQIDAAINAGNSGGPAFNDRGQCVGIAFQSLKHEDAENIGYVIPTPVINHFITDYVRTGDYTGFPILGIEWQKMENPDLRKALGMKPNQKGVRIRRVEPTAPAAKQLLTSDILLSFDDIEIANDGTGNIFVAPGCLSTYSHYNSLTADRSEAKWLYKSSGRLVVCVEEQDAIHVYASSESGTVWQRVNSQSYLVMCLAVPFRHGERIGFSYLVSQKYTGEVARIKILRNSKLKEFEVELANQKRLVPAHIKGKPPSYYIIAGIVFAAVSVPYLRSEYGKDYDYDSPVKLLDKLLHAMAQTEEEQLVVVSQVLVADINIGYEDIVNTQILAFNNVPVKNLKHLATMVENCEDPFLRFDLEYQQIVVLETKAAKAATVDILATHCIPSAFSDDLRV